MFNKYLLNSVGMTQKQKYNMLQLVKQGHRETEIYNNATYAQCIQNTDKYKIIRVWADDKFFDYDCISNRITA